MINSDLIAVIKRRLDDASTDATQADFSVDDVIKELRVASGELASEPLFKRVLFPTSSSTITIVSGTSSYAMPTDHNFYTERVVYDSGSTDNKRNLLYVEPNQIFDYQYNQGSAVGFYTIRGNNLILAGIPGASDVGKTIEVHYSAMETASTYANDGVETTLGKNCPHLLIDRAVYQLSLSAQEGELTTIAREAKENYREGLHKKLMEFEELGAQGPHFMQTSEDYPL